MQKLQLSIPEPCHENWQQMTPTEQGRFCNACAKEVIDFSMMTDTEVLNYFIKITHENVCGRALPSQLERTIVTPLEPKKRLFWYWNYIVMFFMFFGKGNAVKAQGGIKPITEINPVNANGVRGEVAAVNVSKQQGSRVISGKVTDVNGNPVSFALIKIKGKNTEVHADANGNYSIKVKAGVTLEINNDYFKYFEVAVGTGTLIDIVLEKTDKPVKEVVIMGCRAVKRTVRIATSAAVNVDTLYVIDGVIASKAKADNLNPDDISEITRLGKSAAAAIFGIEGKNGAVVITTGKSKARDLDTVTVTAYPVVGRLKKVTTTSITILMGAVTNGHTISVNNPIIDSLKTIATAITGAIKIYPNPVRRNTGFSIALKLKQPGNNYSFLITDAAGKILLQQKFNASAKYHTEKITGDRGWAAGVYFIRIFDTQNKLVSKSSFIFQ